MQCTCNTAGGGGDGGEEGRRRGEKTMVTRGWAREASGRGGMDVVASLLTVPQESGNGPVKRSMAGRHTAGFERHASWPHLFRVY